MKSKEEMELLILSSIFMNLSLTGKTLQVTNNESS